MDRASGWVDRSSANKTFHGRPDLYISLLLIDTLHLQSVYTAGVSDLTRRYNRWLMYPGMHDGKECCL